MTIKHPFEALGADELMLIPTVDDPDEVSHLADAGLQSGHAEILSL
ncbi:hypothetical protein [Actinacidiphila glaucinigra]